MKIAFVCNEYPPRQHGGIGTFVGHIAPAMAAMGHEVRVFEFGEHAASVEREGVRIMTVPMSATLPGSWLLDRLRLRRALDADIGGACDVVETSDFEGFTPFGLRRSVLVSRLHQSSTALMRLNTGRARRSVEWREARSLSRSDGWIAVSDHALSLTRLTFPAITPPATRTIYSPIVVSATPVAAEFSGPFVLFAGYVSHAKGADRLARIMRPIMERTPELRLVYVGKVLDPDGRPGGMKADIENALGPECAQRCVFAGFVDHARLHALMRSALCLAFPSPLETFGLVVGEAMLLGCPVVTSRAEPFTEYVTHDESGLLCESDAEWIEAIGALVGSVDLRRNIGDGGKAAAAQRFSIETCVRQTLSFYDELIAARGRKGSTSR
jgi:glycosyltransferase involved in cell wall biosynthesis